MFLILESIENFSSKYFLSASKSASGINLPGLSVIGASPFNTTSCKS